LPSGYIYIYVYIYLYTYLRVYIYACTTQTLALLNGTAVPNVFHGFDANTWYDCNIKTCERGRGGEEGADRKGRGRDVTATAHAPEQDRERILYVHAFFARMFGRV